MSTYEEFMIILTTALLIVAILNMKNKKQPFASGKVNGYFLAIHKPEEATTPRLSVRLDSYIIYFDFLICQAFAPIKNRPLRQQGTASNYT